MKTAWLVLAVSIIAVNAWAKDPESVKQPERKRPAAKRTAPVVSAQPVKRECASPQAVVNQTVVIVNVISDDVATADYLNEQIDGFYQPGYDWGVMLKAYRIDWAEFVPYLQRYIVQASRLGKDAFRRGFIAGYGESAEATYDHALRQACQRS